MRCLHSGGKLTSRDDRPVPVPAQAVFDRRASR